MEELKCPSCGKELESIQEEYHSIGVYTYDNSKNQFIIENKRRDVKEEYFIKCPYCNNLLPLTLQKEVEDKLPKV